jgi:hypothetical protein
MAYLPVLAILLTTTWTLLPAGDANAERFQLANAPTVIGCSAGTYPPSTEFISRPHECIVYRGNVEAHYTQVWMQKLRWRGWGGRSATARGRWHYCGMGSCPSGPLKARAYRPVFACGRYAYTRMRVHIVVHNYHDSTSFLHLHSC